MTTDDRAYLEAWLQTAEEQIETARQAVIKAAEAVADVQTKLGMSPLRKTALFLILAAAATAPARAQFSPAAPAGWKQITVPCSASPTFDMSKGTAFLITLCATPATAVFTNVSKANGRHVDILVCQDATGGRSFTYPNLVLGTVPINSLPNICTAQAFGILNNQVFAFSTGVQQSNQPVPNLFQPPWSTMTYIPADGNLTITNELTGVVLTIANPEDFGSKQVSWYTRANSGSGIVTATTSFWVEQPDTTGTNYYGFGEFSQAGNQIPELCAYAIGPTGQNQALYTHNAVGPSVIGSSLNFPQTFTTPSRQIILRYSQDLTASTATCSYSTDGGSTFNSFPVRGNDYFGALINPFIGIGGSWAKPAGAKMHITGFSIQ